MNIPLQHVIRPGIIHCMAFPSTGKGEGPILETCRQILADDFFEVIEITWIKDPATRAKVKSMLASAGVEAKHVGQPRLLSQKLDLNSADEAVRQRAIEEIKRAVDEAAEMGIRDVGLLSGSDVAPAERPAAMDRLENSLVELCRYAAKSGCNIVLEVFDRDIDKKCLIGPAAAAREIAERVKRTCPNFGLMVDLSHIPLLGESPAQALQPVRDPMPTSKIERIRLGAISIRVLVIRAAPTTCRKLSRSCASFLRSVTCGPMAPVAGPCPWRSNQWATKILPS
ncbi:MAG: TIM barrel protein [Verrucomicrobiia bacterium]